MTPISMSENAERPPRVAVIGCGAITESFYLPALAKHPSLTAQLYFVDPDVERARLLADRLGAAHVAASHSEIASRVDAAIIATPHAHHFRVAMDMIEQGVHVLCEKPLAETEEQARTMVRAAAEKKTLLGVNNTRRLFPASATVKRLVSEGAIGALQRVEYYEGGEFNWPAASGSYFTGGKGVLLDRGAHVLDLICWWLDAEPVLDSCDDDSFGGTEAVARVQFHVDDCQGEVRLSWLNKLRNSYRLVGAKGEIVGSIYEWRNTTLLPVGARPRRFKLKSPVKAFTDFGSILVDNFLDAVRGRAELLVPGAAVVDSIALLEKCYTRRTHFTLPWYDEIKDDADVGS